MRVSLVAGLAVLFHGSLLFAQTAQRTPTEEEIGKEEVLLSAEQARKEVFPEATVFEQETKNFSAESIQKIEKKLGRSFEEHNPTFDKAKGKSGEALGYGVVLDEKGKYRPITLFVGVTPEFKVRDVAVMVYRESRGGEVKRKRFLNQFKGKTSTDPLRVHRDIIHITGATISSHSVASAIQRALYLTQAAYDPNWESGK
jgi:Na+-translocating ferredoxin:NAD+ oxidoreductase RnfG subunit